MVTTSPRRVRRRAKLVAAIQYDGTQEGCHRLVGFSTQVDLPCMPGAVRLIHPRGTLVIGQGDWLVRDPDTLEVTLVTNGQFFRDYDHVGVWCDPDIIP